MTKTIVACDGEGCTATSTTTAYAEIPPGWVERRFTDQEIYEGNKLVKDDQRRHFCPLCRKKLVPPVSIPHPEMQRLLEAQAAETNRGSRVGG